MTLIRIKPVVCFCLIIAPLVIFSQFNEDIQVFSRCHTFDVIKSENDLFHIIIDDTYVDSTVYYEGLKYITVDTLLNQTSLQTYPWAKYAHFPSIDVKNDLVGITWLHGRFAEIDSIKGAVFNSALELDSNSVIYLSDSITFSFSGTTRSTPKICFLNDTLLVAIWIQANPDVDHFSIFGQLFTSSNEFIGSNFKINDQYRIDVDCGFDPVIHPLHSGDGFAVVWMDHPYHVGDIYGQIFNLDGTPRDSSFSITGDYPHYIAGLYNFSMDMDSSDNILTCFSAWDDSYKWNIYYGWSDLNGTALTDIDTIINIPFDVRELSWVNCNISDEGRSIITWQAFEDNRRVFCQRFDNDHSPMGLPFCVSHSDRSTDQDYQYSFIHEDRIYSFWNESHSIWGSIIEFDNPPVSIAYNSEIKTFSLSQNHPNPFNPTTTIRYQLPAVSDVQMIIFDISGRKIRQWSYQNQSAGTYEITWNGKDQIGNPVPSGVYIYGIEAGEYVHSQKMVLIK
jgi:hypothetical protein